MKWARETGMEKNKKKICIAGLVLLIAASCSGCGFWQDIKDILNYFKSQKTGEPYVSVEEEAYREAANEFLSAIEAGDRDAVRDCFSVNVQKSDTGMEEQIDRLLELCTCSGEITFKNEDNLQFFGEYSNDHGKRTALAGETVIYTCGDTYFWCFMGLTYRNDEDPDDVGITYANVQTKEFQCAMRSDEDYGEHPDFQEPGLRVLTEEQLKRPVEGDIRVIDGNATVYTPSAVLDEEEVTAFLEQDSSYSGFIEHFGPPCGGWVYDYYDLPEENGEFRYLCVGADDRNDEIFSVSVCDDVKSLRQIWAWDKD